MFSKSKLSSNKLPVSASGSSEVPSIFAAGLKLVGNLTSCGGIEIEGEIEGNVNCAEVTVRRDGSVKGDVIADSVHVDGEIHGLVKGRNIYISETGRVTGVVMYENLSIKDGAYIDGQCKSSDRLHRGEVEKINEEETAETKALEESAEVEKVSYIKEEEGAKVEEAAVA